MENDQTYIDRLLEEGWQSRLNNVAYGRELTDQAYQLARTQAYTIGIVRGLRNLAALHNAMHEYEKGLEYVNEALSILGEEADSPIDYFDLYLLAATVYHRLGDIPESFNYSYKAEDIAVSMGSDVHRAEVYKTIGNSYLMIQEYENAVSYYDRAREILHAINDVEGEIMILNNLCHCYHHAGQYGKALSSGHLGLELYEQIVETGKPIQRVYAYNLNNVGSTYVKADQFNEATPFFTKALELFAQNRDYYGEVYSWRGLGEISLHNEDYEEALFRLQCALELSKLSGIVAEIVKSHRTLAHAYKQMNMPGEALEHFEKFYEFERSIINDEIEKKIRTLESTHRVQQAQKEAEIYQLKNVALQNEIDERKKAEQQLQLYAAELERSNKELENFASIVSHDLQAPLRKIIAFSERLQERNGDQLDGQGTDYLNRMHSASLRMQQLIRDLLSLSRATTHRQTFSEIDVYELVQDILNDFEVAIEESKAVVEVGQLPKIEADETQLRQLLQNLIGNALKFRRPDVAPIIQISSKVIEEADREFCQIEVSDNGIGIEEVYRERIFEVFERLHTRSKIEGSGLGLAICQRIVERHRGTITVESVLDEGCTFIVTLPVSQL